MFVLPPYDNMVIMRRYYYVYAIAVILIIGCNGNSKSEDIKQDRLAFSQNELTVFVNETLSIPISYEKWDRGVYVPSEYDFVSNPYDVTVISSDKSIAEIISDGKIKGISEGNCTLSISAKEISVSGTLHVVVKQEKAGVEFVQDLTQPLSPDMIVLPVGLTSVAMQGMDIDKRGVCYMSWEENSSMFVRAYNKDGTSMGKEMALPSGGHGDGFSIENKGDDVFFWTSGTLGEHLSNGGYSGGKAADDAVRLICRHKFVPGATQYAEDAVERFFLNNNGCRFVEVDTEHDVMLCWTYENNKDYFYVFSLSGITEAPIINKTITRSSHNKGTEVTAYDLQKITPIAKFSWERKGTVTGETNSGAVQGLCVYKDRIYVESGGKNDEAALVSVLDFQGKILQKQVKLGVSADKQKLIELNLSSDGTFEPEGLHIRNGIMYLGFVGDYPTSGAKKHACILKLK